MRVLGHERDWSFESPKKSWSALPRMDDEDHALLNAALQNASELEV